MSTRTRGLVMVLVLASSILAGVPARAAVRAARTEASWAGRTSALSLTTIQPGVPIRTGNSGCTLNWIYDRVARDPASGVELHEGVYAGTAAHCVAQVGQEVHLLDQQLGSELLRIGHVAFRAPELDYAFIRIDEENLRYVDPSLRGHPAIPTGVSTTATSRVGDAIRFSGHGVGSHLHPLTQRERVGSLCHNDGVHHSVYGPVTQGDSGGPVANATDGNKALGIVATVGFNMSFPEYVCAGEGGLSLEGIFQDAQARGWDMRLRRMVSEVPTIAIAGGEEGDGNQVTVEGAVEFPDQPFTKVGTDPAGDVTIPGHQHIGGDLVGASVATGSAGDLLLRWEVTSLPEPTDGALAGIIYGWTFCIDSADCYEVLAQRSALASDGLSGNGRLFRCASPQCDPSSHSEVIQSFPVAFDATSGTVTARIPWMAVDLQAGNKIASNNTSLGEPVWIASGDLWAGAWTRDGADSIEEVDAFTVAGRAVHVALGQPGLDPVTVTYVAEAEMSEAERRFKGVLVAEGESAPRSIYARACFGEGNCAYGVAEAST